MAEPKDEAIEAMALAIANESRRGHGLPPMASLSDFPPNGAKRNRALACAAYSAVEADALKRRDERASIAYAAGMRRAAEIANGMNRQDRLGEFYRGRDIAAAILSEIGEQAHG